MTAAGLAALVERVDWCYTDGFEFDDPFFDQTIQLCLREPARMLFRRSTPLGALRAATLPDGIVAHLSLCGSTLVTQLLAARGDVTAWSEPPVVDQVARTAAAGSCDVKAVRAVFGQFAASRRPRSIVKLDAWTTLDLPLSSKPQHRCPLSRWCAIRSRCGSHTRAARDAKNPVLSFEPDTEEKRRAECGHCWLVGRGVSGAVRVLGVYVRVAQSYSK